jgi:hypothetical protein
MIVININENLFGFKIYLLTCPPILFKRFIVSITKIKSKIIVEKHY